MARPSKTSTGRSLRIRESTVADVPLILRFIHKKALFDGIPDAVQVTSEVLSKQLFGSRPAGFVIFAEIEDCVVGFAAYFLTFSSFLGKSGIWLDDLYVDKNARGRGIGRSLLIYLAQLAHERDYGRIEWTAAGTNERGLAFYKRHGAKVLEGTRLLRLRRSEISQLAKQWKPAPQNAKMEHRSNHGKNGAVDSVRLLEPINDSTTQLPKL